MKKDLKTLLEKFYNRDKTIGGLLPPGFIVRIELDDFASYIPMRTVEWVASDAYTDESGVVEMAFKYVMTIIIGEGQEDPDPYGNEYDDIMDHIDYHLEGSIMKLFGMTTDNIIGKYKMIGDKSGELLYSYTNPLWARIPKEK